MKRKAIDTGRRPKNMAESFDRSDNSLNGGDEELQQRSDTNNEVCFFGSVETRAPRTFWNAVSEDCSIHENTPDRLAHSEPLP